jgi:hypothetical protein
MAALYGSAAVLLLLAQVHAQTPSATVQVTQTSTAKAGYTTYQVGVQFDNTVRDVYALFGELGEELVIPPAFQLAAPFGTDTGPVRRRKLRATFCIPRAPATLAAQRVQLTRPTYVTLS